MMLNRKEKFERWQHWKRFYNWKKLYKFLCRSEIWRDHYAINRKKHFYENNIDSFRFLIENKKLASYNDYNYVLTDLYHSKVQLMHELETAIFEFWYCYIFDFQEYFFNKCDNEEIFIDFLKCLSHNKVVFLDKKFKIFNLEQEQFFHIDANEDFYNKLYLYIVPKICQYELPRKSIYYRIIEYPVDYPLTYEIISNSYFYRWNEDLYNVFQLYEKVYNEMKVDCKDLITDVLIDSKIRYEIEAINYRRNKDKKTMNIRQRNMMRLNDIEKIMKKMWLIIPSIPSRSYVPKLKYMPKKLLF